MSSTTALSSPLSSPTITDDDVSLAFEPLIDISVPVRENQKRKTALQPQQKLDAALKYLAGLRWTLEDLLEQLYESKTVKPKKRMKKKDKEKEKQGKRRRSLAWGYFKRFAYRTLPDSGREAKDLLDANEQQGLRSWSMPLICEILRKEISSLAQHAVFGAFQDIAPNPKVEVEQILEKSPEVIVTNAPTWLCLFHVASHPTQTQKPMEIKPERLSQLAKDRILIFSALCRQMQPRLSDGIACIIGIYLYEGGARTRVIDTMHRLGVCVSSKSVLKRVHSMEGAAEENVRLLGIDTTSVVTWDNFEFREGRRGEREGDETEFRSITTALVTENRYPELASLDASLWKPIQIPLSAKSIFLNLQGDGVPKKVGQIMQISIADDPSRSVCSL